MMKIISKSVRFSILTSLLGVVLYTPLMAEDGEDIDISRIPVTVVSSKQTDLVKKVRVQGDIDTSTQPVIAAEIAAKVISMRVGEGEVIEKGRVLAVLDKEPLEIAKEKALANIQRIKVLIINQERIVTRNRKLNKDKLLSQTSLDDAETALSLSQADLIVVQAQLKDTEYKLQHVNVISPFDAVVQKKLTSNGDYLKVGSGIYKIVSLKDIYARLYFPETLAGSIQTPTTVMLHHGDEQIEGKLINFRPMLERGNRALHGLVLFDNSLGWKPGYSIVAEVVLEVHKNAVVVPLQSVVRRPSGLVVYVIENDTAMQVNVTTGLVDGDQIEILTGLSANSIIALDGAPFLSDGVQVSVKAHNGES